MSKCSLSIDYIKLEIYKIRKGYKKKDKYGDVECRFTSLINDDALLCRNCKFFPPPKDKIKGKFSEIDCLINDNIMNPYTIC